MLYSHQGSRPAPLPFRITLASGFTRTDPATFTPEEIAESGFTGPFTEPPYDPTTQALDWIDGAYVVRDLPPPEPTPDWGRFKGALLSDPAANTALAQALPVAPSAVLALPAALIAAAAGADPADFFAAWGALRAADLIPADLLTTIGALAVACHLPTEFTTEMTRPFAQSVGQTWTAPNGSQWRVIQARDPQGQFLADDPATPARESLEWELVA